MSDLSGRRELADLKARIDPAQFAQDQYGIEFDSRGWACCPHGDKHNHGDRNPSLQLHKKTFKCWSQQCFGERGADVFGLVMKMEGMGLNGAKKIVAQYVGGSGVHQ